ncbi:MAG: hypothetical protein FWH12_02320 [Treponema sp.]|nr:hypothetical protein [Treponema sp.]
MNRKILIIGYGNIGKHIHEELKPLDPDIYDPYIPEFSKMPTENYDVAFIAVPTEMNHDGSCNISIVIESVKNANAKVIAIRSTVPPGTNKELTKITGKTIVSAPEFYGVSQHSKRNLDFIILGADGPSKYAVGQVFAKVKTGNYRIHYTDSLTAELVKYMLNCYLAMKVTFCNEFALVANKIGVEYQELRELFILDERISPSHTISYPEQPFYDNHCFNKDVPAFLKFTKSIGIEPKLVEAVEKVNKEMKSKYGGLDD